MKIADRVTIICIAFNMKNGLKRRLKVLSFRINYSKELIIIDNGSTGSLLKSSRRWVSQRSGKYVCSDNFYGKKEHAYCGLFNQSSRYAF